MEPIKTNTQKRASTLTINGRVLDAVSGHPVGGHQPKTRQFGSFDVKPSTAIHAGPAKSQTLRRTGLAKPEPARPLASRHVRSISPITTRPEVTRFGRPADAAINDAHVVSPSDVLSSLNGADTSEQPIVLATQVQNYAPAAKLAPAPRTHAPTTSKKVTEHQLKHAPGRPAHASTSKVAHPAHPHVRKTGFLKKVSKRLHLKLTPPIIVVGTIILVLAIGAICYMTVPALSLFVAARSAGVAATYPGYVPSGYHFKGPVTYGEGKVSMTFAAAGSDKTFTVEQSTTFWDSGAVLDNYVLARTDNYLTYSEGGMTIYTFGSQAAWVNAGVLHTIDGSAQLTSDQILRIAASM